MTTILLCRIVGAISGSALSQYFRSFLVKLSMMESQLGPLIHDGLSRKIHKVHSSDAVLTVGDVSFAIVLELLENKVPLASQTKVHSAYYNLYASSPP